ncbi:retrovirus-related Pol polyprotein from transposon opus [Trichonephila clavipes]|nr:retrovirus-related Pol polyprotein from transposon opus [Trichonephila clavipes]
MITLKPPPFQQTNPDLWFIQDSVKVFLVYPRSTTVSELRRFLALLNFYHRFFTNAAALQAKLYSLIKRALKEDATPITWTDSLAVSFEGRNNLISQARLLCYHIEGAQLSLKVDASKRAIGACLQHVSDGKQPLAFFPAPFESG